MKDIMIELFGEYNFIKTWEENNKIFFVNADKSIVSYLYKLLYHNVNDRYALNKHIFLFVC